MGKASPKPAGLNDGVVHPDRAPRGRGGENSEQRCATSSKPAGLNDEVVHPDRAPRGRGDCNHTYKIKHK